MAELSFFVGVIGNVISVLMFLSPRNILADYKEEIDGGVRELSVRVHLAELFSLDLLRCYQAWSLPRSHRKFLWRCCTVFLPRRFPHLRTVGNEGQLLNFKIFSQYLCDYSEKLRSIHRLMD
ncbi:hypothetical protein SDJN02_10172 [Cucurbita argyrosperma subsp. argyrosperma]|nr:hypothetical protein SDJN02_10172 [Cucurbita argyrosperma subsp. argyrosperma]